MNLKAIIKELKEASESEKKFSSSIAKKLGDELGVDWNHVDVEQLRMGLEVESEHDDSGPLDVVGPTKDLAKIALAHLREDPKYYTKLRKMEKDKPERETEVLKRR